MRWEFPEVSGALYKMPKGSIIKKAEGYLKWHRMKTYIE